MSIIPGLLEEVDRLGGSAINVPEEEISQAINRALTLETKMNNWNTALQNSVGDVALFWAEDATPDPNEDPELEQLFKYKIRFKLLRLAQLHQIYWAARVQVYNAMEELLLTHERVRRLSPSDGVNTSNISTALLIHTQVGRSITQISALGTYYADMCCQAQDYICSPEMGAVGPQSTMAAIGMIKMFYQTHDLLKFRWCRREFGRLSARGFGAARLLSSLDRDGYAALGRQKDSVWQPPAQRMRDAREAISPNEKLSNPPSSPHDEDIKTIPMRSRSHSGNPLDLSTRW
jgi:hypothetical protein